jgi:hypothetical protein
LSTLRLRQARRLPQSRTPLPERFTSPSANKCGSSTVLA